MNYRSSIVAGTIGIAALSAGCMSSTGVSAPRPFSYIDVRELPDTSGTKLIPFASAVFVKDRVTGFIPSYALNESCGDPTTITPDVGGGGAVSNANLDPGAVSLTLKGTVDTTTRTVPLTMTGITSGGLAQYTNNVRPNLTAGDDSLFFKVARQACGFPPFTLSSPSVPHFVAQPVDDSITGQGIRVQWTGLPAGSPTRMQISLQYVQGTGSTPNTEVRCVAFDDGDFTIPRQYVSGWEDAGVDSLHSPHQIVLSRFNTVGANVADGLAVLVARIDTTITKQ